MSPNIIKYFNKGRKAFSIVEALLATFVVLYVFLSVVSVYIMVWRWWHEVAPRIEAQRIARVALSSIIDGAADPTAGTYTVNSVTYKRRSGIAWATSSPDIPSQSQINFMLVPDSSNIRSFYITQDDEDSTKEAVYYKDYNNATLTPTVHKIASTVGITDLKFEKFLSLSNIIKVTATVEKEIKGTRQTPYNIKVEYNDIVYLRNVT